MKRIEAEWENRVQIPVDVTSIYTENYFFLKLEFTQCKVVKLLRRGLPGVEELENRKKLAKERAKKKKIQEDNR